MAAPTTGQMLAAIASEWAAVDTAKLFWDDTNTRLGIGGGAPGYRLDVGDTGAANNVAYRIFRLYAGADATLGTLQFVFDIYPSATAASRYAAIGVGDSTAWRNLALCPSGGKVGIYSTAPVALLSIGYGGDVWTTGSWRRSIEVSTSSMIKWTKSTNDCAWGIGSTGNNLYVGYSTADDASAAIAYKGRWDYATGDFYTNDGTVSSLSDISSKIKIKDYTPGLAAIMALSPAIYVHDKNAEINGKKFSSEYPMADGEFVGLSAQDVQKVIPDAVKTDVNGILSMKTGPILYTLVNAVKELSAKVDKLEKEKPV